MSANEQGLLAVGTTAPAFNQVEATGGRAVSLADYAGRYLVMVFYPKDQTPGCTQQLCSLRDDMALFNDLRADVIGVNPDNVASHQAFAEKQGYTFPLLVDADKSIARAYGALKEEDKIKRTVYVINPDGKVAFAQEGMPTDAQLADVIRKQG